MAIFVSNLTGCASTKPAKIFFPVAKSPRKKVLNLTRKKDTPTLSSKAYAHYSTGMIYDNEGKTSEAIEEYQKAIQLDPNAAPLYYRLGASLIKSGQLDSAIAALEKAKNVDKEAVSYTHLTLPTIYSV